MLACSVIYIHTHKGISESNNCLHSELRDVFDIVHNQAKDQKKHNSADIVPFQIFFSGKWKDV